MSLSSLYERAKEIAGVRILILLICFAALVDILYRSRKKPFQLVFLIIILPWAGLESFIHLSHRDSTFNDALATMENTEKLLSYAMASISVFLCFAMLSAVWRIKKSARLASELPQPATDPSSMTSDATTKSDTPSRTPMAFATAFWLISGFYFASRVREPDTHWFWGTLGVIRTIASWEVIVVTALFGLLLVVYFVVFLVLAIRRERPEQGAAEVKAAAVVSAEKAEKTEKTGTEDVGLDEKFWDVKA